jgi:hypothetical protein
MIHLALDAIDVQAATDILHHQPPRLTASLGAAVLLVKTRPRE